MVATYTIFGRQIGSHYLAMTTLGALFGGVYLALPSGKKQVATTPPINASTADEADFIKKFLDEAEGTKSKH